MKQPTLLHVFLEAVRQRDLATLSVCLDQYRALGIQYEGCLARAKTARPDLTDATWEQWMYEIDGAEQ